MKTILIAVAALVVVVGAGCGTATGATPSAIGHWRGTFTDSVGQQSGTVDIVVSDDPNGTVAGVIHNTTLNLDGNVSGTVNRDNDIDATYTYPGNGPYHATGRMVISTNGSNMAGFVRITSGATVVSENTLVNLNRQ